MGAAMSSHSETTFTKDKTAGQEVSVLCVQCKRRTKHQIVSSFDADAEAWHPDEGWSVNWIDNYQVVQCKGCEGVSFRHAQWFSEDQYSDDDSPEDHALLYPKRSENTYPIRDFYNVPSSLRRIFREVVDAFNTESSTLCAAGLRAIVEGICAAQGVIDGPVEVPTKTGPKIERRSNLEGKIAGLAEKNFLTNSSAATLHELRFMGNDAVHELDRPPTEALRLAIEIVEHMFEHLYEIPQKASELRSKFSRDK
ncbi:hypothetical protein C6Q35_27505 [Burkholderia multivorans]|nr:hypothetical protein C6Q35_27505 [Burkholderia multivorans]